MNNHVYDTVFRTLAQKTPYLFIELINEVFKTNYKRRTKFEPLRNEFVEKGGKVITDSIYRIGNDIYHIECQSTKDGKMTIRMLQYDFFIAVERAGIENHPGRVELPKSCVLYLKSDNNTPKQLNTELVQGDKSMMYTSEVIKLSDYMMDDIFRKNLFVLIPFYLIKYSDAFVRDKVNAKTVESLMADCNVIVSNMKAGRDITEQEYTDIIQAFVKISNHILRKHSEAKKEVNKIMGGEIYETASEKLMKKGRKAGREEATVEAVEQFAQYFLSNNQAKTIEEARELARSIIKK